MFLNSGSVTSCLTLTYISVSQSIQMLSSSGSVTSCLTLTHISASQSIQDVFELWQCDLLFDRELHFWFAIHSDAFQLWQCDLLFDLGPHFCFRIHSGCVQTPLLIPKGLCCSTNSMSESAVCNWDLMWFYFKAETVLPIA